MKRVTISPRGAVARGALMVYLQPRLAMDERIDLTPALRGVTSENWSERKPKIAKEVRKLCKGKLAQDATLEQLDKLLDALGGAPDTEEQGPPPMAGGADPVDNQDANMPPASTPALPPDTNPPAPPPGPATAAPVVAPPPGPGETNDADMTDAVMQILENAGVTPDVMQAVAQAMQPAAAAAAGEEAEQNAKQDVMNEDPDPDQSEDTDLDADVGEQPVEDTDLDPDKDCSPSMDNEEVQKGPAMQPPGVTKAAMDAAIKAATLAERGRQRALRDAMSAVRPYVGDVAMDSADEVYQYALGKLGVKEPKKIHPSAYPALLAHCPRPGSEAQVRRERSMALDADVHKKVVEAFPGIDRVRVLG